MPPWHAMQGVHGCLFHFLNAPSHIGFIWTRSIMIHACVSIYTRSHVLETSSFVDFDLSIANCGRLIDHAFASIFLFALRLSLFIFSRWFHWRYVWSSLGSALRNISSKKGNVSTLRGIWRVRSTISCNLLRPLCEGPRRATFLWALLSAVAHSWRRRNGLGRRVGSVGK